ncbi:hypothetical protein BGZ89_001811 [Linnemannia elongata]|nr:hypothetical protein BGZ89_001811 [Linnemannia elongata]
MATLCLSQLRHTPIRSSTGPKQLVRAISSSAPSFYSRAKNSSTNATTTATAGVASLSPSILLHALFRNEVTKIHVQGSVSTKTAAPAVTVSTKDALKLTFEKLNWRGVPQPSQVLSTNVFVQSETDKTVTWTTASATTPVSATKPGSRQSPKVPSAVAAQVPRKETYRVNKRMMLSNPSFSFVMDQIEHQSRLSYGKATQS